MDDMALLREYATRNSEAAFAELVSRRAGFVYAAALRQVRDPHLAQEITQAVFIVLAQKAGRISDKTNLIGWLFKTTRFAALAQMRAAAKRQRREQEAQMQSELQSTAPDALWEQMSPLLDEALTTLGEKDRQAVLLRFFENKSLAEVGNNLGAGEDTARKRVSRALEKLRKFFSKRGVVSTTTIIAGVISANSIQAAPVVLAKSVTAVAIVKGAAASGSTLILVKGALNLMAWAKAKTATLIGAALIAVGATAYVWQVKPNDSSAQEFQATVDRLSHALTDTSPQVKIVPTKYPDSHGGGFRADDKTIGISMPMRALIQDAYGVNDYHRVIISTKLPDDKYDYIANLPSGSGKALQQEIKKQFGIIGRFEPQPKDVLVLKVKNADTLKSKLTPRKNKTVTLAGSPSRGVLWEKSGFWTEGNKYVWRGQPVRIFADSLEAFFNIPVVDETGITDLQKYNFDLDWDLMSRDGGKLNQALNEVGFELIATNQPIAMLVVEKVK